MKKIKFIAPADCRTAVIRPQWRKAFLRTEFRSPLQLSFAIVLQRKPESQLRYGRRRVIV